MSVTVSQFGKTSVGKEIKLYTIENSKGMKAAVTNIGACLVNLEVPNKKNELVDVLLGFDKGECYLVNGSFFGGVIGRSANRIADSAFTIDGKEYKLCVNDGVNNLHTDFDLGFHKVIWNAEYNENSVTFSYYSPDMECGFPGNMDVKVTYTLTDDNEIKIDYDAVSDKKTLINLTNHAYFNLSGHNSGNIENTLLTINASAYTPVVKGAIPTGEIAPVAGTVFDFTKEKLVGKEINADEEQLKLVSGYDHNFVLDNYDKNVRKIAEAKAGDFSMEVYTDLPGVQFYSGNGLATQQGKGGAMYTDRSGFCLETQYYPNSVNQEGFVSPVFDAGERCKTTTIYKFAVL